MEGCSKSNLSKMEQSEFSKLINDKTAVIKPADKKVGVAAILFVKHHNASIYMMLAYTCSLILAYT